MKNLPLTLFAFFVILFSACDKEGTIEKENLSQCPADANCDYYFKTNSSVHLQNGEPVSGDSTVFVYKQVNYEESSYLLIRVPKNSSSFKLNKNDMQNGHVNYIISCPACLRVEIPTYITQGVAHGTRINDQKWLVEANVVFASVYDNRPVDTVSVRQYFILKNSN